MLTPYVLPVTVGLVALLFAIQHRGSGKWGYFRSHHAGLVRRAGPTGSAQCDQTPGVLLTQPIRCMPPVSDSPPGIGFLVLGSVFLVLTGAEALYADMGHFGRRPIQVGWFAVALPALLLQYFGQGALSDAEPGGSPTLLSSGSGWMLYPLIALATLATIIASQAMLSGAFSLTLQAVQLGYLPLPGLRTPPRSSMGKSISALLNC